MHPRAPAALLAMPRLDDDGQRIHLDLHGVAAARALGLTEAAIIEAARHGRNSLRIIHGASTAERGAARTIRSTLRDAVESGVFERHVTSHLFDDTSMLLGLAPSPQPARGRVRLADVW